jgi:hypothetical protein
LQREPCGARGGRAVERGAAPPGEGEHTRGGERCGDRAELGHPAEHRVGGVAVTGVREGEQLAVDLGAVTRPDRRVADRGRGGRERHAAEDTSDTHGGP